MAKSKSKSQSKPIGKPASKPGAGSDAESGDRPAPDRDPAWVDELRRRLLDWYRAHRRDLPWRGDGRTPVDPYRILVSEAMLVQTTVAAVVPYFERFLSRFPTVADLARADEADVLKAWEGLGYYRRARLLREAARAVVERHGGIFPDDPAAILALPGVGRYIAGAILSFAFDRPAPILEANTQRVAARWLALEGPLAETRNRERLWELAARVVPPDGGAGDFNQAFMELGALVCRPSAPSCLLCPVSNLCAARARGVVDRIPTPAPRAAPLEVRETCVVPIRKAEGGGGADIRVLAVRRGESGLWPGFWEFPTLHHDGPNPAGRPSLPATEDPTEALLDLCGLRLELVSAPAPASGTRPIRFTVTKHKVDLAIRAARAVSGGARPGLGLTDARWVALDELDALPLSAATRKIAARLRDGTLRADLPGA